MIIDQAQDRSGRHTDQLCADYDAPDFVKQASAEQQGRQGVEELNDRQFADPSHRRYPVHTKSATWLSTACFFTRKEASKQDSHIESRLAEQAELFQIYGEFLRLKEAAATQPEEAKLPDECYAYLFQHQGALQRWLPIVDPADVTKAAGYLQKFASMLPYNHREQIALRTLNRAETLQVELDSETRDYLHKVAGIGLSDPAAVRELLYQRANAARSLKRHNDAEQFEKLARAYTAHPVACVIPQHQSQLMALVTTFDEENDLTRHYGYDMTQPELAVHGITKAALAETQADLVSLVTGSTYTKQALLDVSLGEIRSNLGETIAGEVSGDGLFVDMTKLAEVLPTLPRPDAAVFDRLLARKGLEPVIKSAACEPEEDLTDLCKLADLYLTDQAV